MQEMGWYRAASEIVRVVLSLIDGDLSNRRKDMFVETGSRYVVVYWSVICCCLLCLQTDAQLVV